MPLEGSIALFSVKATQASHAFVTEGDISKLRRDGLRLLQGMFNDDAFSKMKKGARVVNVARGGVIDEAALARALDNRQVAQVQPPHRNLPHHSTVRVCACRPA